MATVYYETIGSPLGEILLRSDGSHLTGLRFSEQERAEGSIKTSALPVFAQTEEWLDCYFSGRVPNAAPPLLIDASPFCKAVYDVIRTIPYGQTRTYGQIAKKLTEDGTRETCSARAVGAALSRNTILLIVPCHRVIGANGSLTGFAGGIERKRLLLELERGDFKKKKNCC
jgi:methylated-DNA-[protein]-cysteine S-methyltransferase